MNIAFAALIVSALSLLTGAAALGWQISSWHYDGRRVRVRLLHGGIGTATAVVGKVGRDGRPKDLSSAIDQGLVAREVIGIAVTNVGRAPVRIDRYSLHPVGGPVSLTPHGDAVGPELPFRLPPGETETWYAYADDARRLTHSAHSIGHITSRRFYMSVELGTGDTKRTKREVRI
ncbi:phosphoribosylamine--glycine ligase [Curtobacterium sp. BH-2-1-1]|uniref:phosphoribosylamine--glycine ligase n=1 Tax=Curtobacterium sp. BH-2-1-1 TaxID=1905847 RepID=UPI0012EA9FD1|nr:phosphoribosylamine--glycine ligase [Curtobacterium sp. BH-2-1-1]